MLHTTQARRIEITDPWACFLDPIDLLRLKPRLPTSAPRERLVLHPDERPRIRHNDLTDRWHVTYRYAVERPSAPVTQSFPTWSRAMLAAIADVNQRLRDWVSTHDGLTDFPESRNDR